MESHGEESIVKADSDRLGFDSASRETLLSNCRLKFGEVWEDPEGRHKVGCIDAADSSMIELFMSGNKARLALHDPPYNLVVFDKLGRTDFIDWCKKWIRNSCSVMDDDSALYVWLGADQNDGFQPLPDFMIMMRDFNEFKPRSFITMRNQRGYGTQKNWMSVRQELLYYIKGNPDFHVQYTDIPKILRGYYKNVGGKMTENVERGKSENIRPGNVWVDIQQVFYKMRENVHGCYAQKPLKSSDRIVAASSNHGDIVIDFFAHSGSTLLSCEMMGRRCFTVDIDPVFCEIAIRRLERFRKTGLTGWQNENPFKPE